MNGLDGYSPFQTGLGGFCNMVRIGLGERGWIEMYADGYADICEGQDSTLIRFTPADGPMLRKLADELESREAEYAAYLHEQEPQREQEREAPAKRPQIIAGPAANSKLNDFALR